MLQPGGKVYFGSGDDVAQGTLTCFVYKPDDQGQLFALTCGHCGAKVGNRIMYDNALLTTPVAFKHDDRFAPNQSSQDDMAIFRIIDPASLAEDNFKLATTQLQFQGTQRRYLINDRMISTASQAARSLGRVKFFGAKTHQATNGRTGVQTPDADDMQDVHRFKITVNGFHCRTGDSGGPVYAEFGALIGMFHMGNGLDSQPGDVGMVIHIDHVFRSLGVELATWANRNRWLPKVLPPMPSNEGSDSDSDDPFGDRSGKPAGGFKVNQAYTAPVNKPTKENK